MKYGVLDRHAGHIEFKGQGRGDFHICPLALRVGAFTVKLGFRVRA